MRLSPITGELLSPEVILHTTVSIFGLIEETHHAAL